MWAKVFEHLERRPDRLDPFSVALQKRNQAEVQQLKLVCKQFRNIFGSDSELVQRLYLDYGFSVALVPSLLAWLHQNKGSIKTFWSTCPSPLVDIVMAGLLSAPNTRMVDVFDAGACSVSLVGSYKRLENCTCRHAQAQHLGLSPSGVLPSLRRLSLHGNFRELHHLTGLTELECVGSHVLDIQKLPPALQYLKILDSSFTGIHAETLPACTALVHLMLRSSSLKGNNAYVYLDSSLSVVPTNIGQLAQLHNLHLSTATGAEARLVELKWVPELTSLQQLSMHFDYGSGDILQHVPLLTKLSYLDISDSDAMDDREACLLHVDIEWHKLQELHKMFIESKRLRLGATVSGILQLPKLQEVSFADSTVHGPGDTSCFAALIYTFARLRPQVKLVLSGGDLVG